MGDFQQWLAELYSHLSYGHIIVLMSMQASLFPVPAELVVLPAGYLASLGQLNPFLVWLSGATGVFIGSCFNYVLARTLGRLLVLKYGPFFMITEQKYHRAERFFLRNAFFALSFGRLLPVVNRALPLPAGVFKMSVLSFAAAAALGAAMHALFWVSLGYYLGGSAIPFLRAHAAVLGVLFFGIPTLYVLLFVVVRRRRANRRQLIPVYAVEAAEPQSDPQT